MTIPQRYREFLATLPLLEVSYGCGGIKLLAADELEKGQLGYSVAQNGASLCSTGPGGWHPDWIVIGHDTACGDPLLIDTGDPTLPLFTALSGQGQWEPLPVAISMDVFARCLVEFARIAERRKNPAEKDRNPLPDQERNNFLLFIANMNLGQQHEFWTALLDC